MEVRRRTLTTHIRTCETKTVAAWPRARGTHAPAVDVVERREEIGRPACDALILLPARTPFLTISVRHHHSRVEKMLERDPGREGAETGSAEDGRRHNLDRAAQTTKNAKATNTNATHVLFFLKRNPEHTTHSYTAI